MTAITRAPWHDYTSRGIYMVTICNSGSCCLFGDIAGDIAIPAGQPGSVHVRASDTGRAIKRVIGHFD